MNDPNESTGTSDATPLSPAFIEFCTKVRNKDPSVLPDPGEPLRFHGLSEREGIELSDALLENDRVTYLELETGSYTNSSAEAMAKYLRSSKYLQNISWPRDPFSNDRESPQNEEMLCCFMSAFQESTSLKELNINFPRGGGPSNLALENMLAHTQTLKSLTLVSRGVQLEDRAVAAARSGLKKNTTLRELTLEYEYGDATVSPILTSLCDHPYLRKLCLGGHVVDLNGLEAVLLSDISKITELKIYLCTQDLRIMGLARVLRALAHRPTLTKLDLHCVPLGRKEARLLGIVLCNTPNLQTLVLARSMLENGGLAELAPALYSNTSIKELDLSDNTLKDMESARLLRDILRSNKTMTTLGLSGNEFGRRAVANRTELIADGRRTSAVGANHPIDFIADGLGSNSTLLNIGLSNCALGDNDVSMLAQTLGSRNTTLQKLSLESTGFNRNVITSVGLGVLLETMEQNSHHITDLDLRHNQTIGNEGANLLARSLGKNALPNLARLSLSCCGIGDDGFIALVSALEQNTSLLQLDLRDPNYQAYMYLHMESLLSERAFLALAESLPKIKVLERFDLDWCTGFASAMPSLLVGLRKNTSLFHIHVPYCAPSSVKPTPENTARCAGGWMQEVECLGYRNRFLPLIRAPEETLPPRGIWSHALARVAILPDVIFELLRSKPSLVPSEETEGKEAVEDTGAVKKRKRGDE